MPKGLVLWGVKSIYYVLDELNNKEYKCTIKGKVLETDFNIKGRRETNPIVVGDYVKFEIIDDVNGQILERLPRKNEFKRLKSKGRVIQTLFANIDCLIVIDSIANPPLRPYFIDRCLFTAEYMGIQVVIIINKIDLKDKNKIDNYEELKSIYKNLGYKIIETSVLLNKGINALKKIINGKICSFNGRSGVGKSTLIRTIDDRYKDIRIGEVSKKYDRGIHTTTYAKIYPIKSGGMIIDTPGIRELSIFIDKAEDVEKYIRDFNDFRNGCKFDNCQHINEPDCNVLKALKKNKLNINRYESYIRMRDTIKKLEDSKI